MKNKVVLPLTAPVIVSGLLLCGTCLASAWYTHRLQTKLASVLSENVASLQVAEELEMSVRQLRFDSFVYLVDQKRERLAPIERDEQQFQKQLETAESTASTAEARACVQSIRTSFEHYQAELENLRQKALKGKIPEALGTLADAHPARHVVEPCQELLRLSQRAMEEASTESERVDQQARWVMLFIGVAGPLGGLVSGLALARRLTHTIGRLRVRVQDIAQRLDQDVGSVKLVADGDIHLLDQQLQHVLARVEEVAERLQRHQREMLRAQQLAAVGQLAASVAHEVRNPLTAIKMLVELGVRPRDPKPLTTNDLQVIHREIARLEQTVQSLLDFARLPTPRPASCALQEVIQQALDLVRYRARQQKVEVVLQTPEEAVVAAINRDQFRTVLINLCLNALEAMPHGGELYLRLQGGAGRGACLEITDTGPGIPLDLLPRLFTPFTTTKLTGTGLGLNISRHIIEEHGGQLTVQNQPEGGACFTIRLPPPGGRSMTLAASVP